MLTTSKNKEDINKIKAQLNNEFEIKKNIGEARKIYTWNRDFER